MQIAATVAVWTVVLLHLAFASGESIGWSQMARRFGYTREQAEIARPLALNQGAYNAGLAVVLGWALLAGHGPTVVAMLCYVIAMALVGAASVRWTLFLLQGGPALLGLGLWLLAR